MDLSARVLGTHATTTLRDRAAAPVLTIGRDRFTRHDLAEVECFNYVAALNLSRACADLGVGSTKEVFETITPLMLAVPQVGAIALAVLGAAFEKKGLGGDAPLEAWVTRHRDEKTQHKEFVTFDTIKAHSAEQRAARSERKSASARKRARRDTAHRLRVDRHLSRHESRATAHDHK
jgi:hypothetical protein